MPVGHAAGLTFLEARRSISVTLTGAAQMPKKREWTVLGPHGACNPHVPVSQVGLGFRDASFVFGGYIDYRLMLFTPMAFGSGTELPHYAKLPS